MSFVPEKSDITQGQESTPRDEDMSKYVEEYFSSSTYPVEAASRLAYYMQRLKLNTFEGIHLRQLRREWSVLSSMHLDLFEELASSDDRPNGETLMVDSPIQPLHRRMKSYTLVLGYRRFSSSTYVRQKIVFALAVEANMIAAPNPAKSEFWSNLNFKIETIHHFANHSSVSISQVDRLGQETTIRLLDSRGLVATALNEHGIPGTLSLLKRALLENDLRSAPRKPLSSEKLAVKLQVYRGKQVRLAFIDHQDVIGVVHSYSLGREGKVTLAVGSGYITFQRVKIKEVTPWYWDDNGINFILPQ